MGKQNTIRMVGVWAGVQWLELWLDLLFYFIYLISTHPIKFKEFFNSYPIQSGYGSTRIDSYKIIKYLLIIFI
jgi:hypothetical protein